MRVKPGSELTEKYPAVEQDLEQVVGQHRDLELEGSPVLHEGGAQHLHHLKIFQINPENISELENISLPGGRSGRATPWAAGWT